MSDYGRIDPGELDRYITGNYGEDELRDEPDDVPPCPECGKPMLSEDTNEPQREPMQELEEIIGRLRGIVRGLQGKVVADQMRTDPQRG